MFDIWTTYFEIRVRRKDFDIVRESACDCDVNWYIANDRLYYDVGELQQLCWDGAVVYVGNKVIAESKDAGITFTHNISKKARGIIIEEIAARPGDMGFTAHGETIRCALIEFLESEVINGTRLYRVRVPGERNDIYRLVIFTPGSPYILGMATDRDTSTWSEHTPREWADMYMSTGTLRNPVFVSCVVF
jgi:hypothetical protein